MWGRRRAPSLTRHSSSRTHLAGIKWKSTLDFLFITRPEVCIWNILRYSLRNWNGKEHDLEKIAHYAEMAWTMGKDEIPKAGQ